MLYSRCNKPFMLEKNYKTHYIRCVNKRQPIPRTTTTLKMRRNSKTGDGEYEWKITEKKLVYKPTRKEHEAIKSKKKKEEQSKLNEKTSYWTNFKVC